MSVLVQSIAWKDSLPIDVSCVELFVKLCSLTVYSVCMYCDAQVQYLCCRSQLHRLSCRHLLWFKFHRAHISTPTYTSLLLNQHRKSFIHLRHYCSVVMTCNFFTY